MNERLFRKKSLERISSPEQLNDYIKVSNPTVWMILIALIVLVIAFFIWSINGRIVTKTSGVGVFQGSNSSTPDSVICFVSDKDAAKLKLNLDVKIYDPNSSSKNYYIKGTVTELGAKFLKKDDVLAALNNEYIVDNLFGKNSYALEVKVKINKLSNGEYAWGYNDVKDSSFAKTTELCNYDIITESVTPISLFSNKSTTES